MKSVVFLQLKFILLLVCVGLYACRNDIDVFINQTGFIEELLEIKPGEIKKMNTFIRNPDNRNSVCFASNWTRPKHIPYRYWMSEKGWSVFNHYFEKSLEKVSAMRNKALRSYSYDKKINSNYSNSWTFFNKSGDVSSLIIGHRQHRITTEVPGELNIAVGGPFFELTKYYNPPKADSVQAEIARVFSEKGIEQTACGYVKDLVVYRSKQYKHVFTIGER